MVTTVMNPTRNARGIAATAARGRRGAPSYKIGGCQHTLTRGCARGTWGLKKMVGILDISVARNARGFFNFFAEEAAGRSEGGASVRPDSATIACRARVGPGNRVCMVCGRSREVVGRCIRLDTNVNS